MFVKLLSLGNVPLNFNGTAKISVCVENVPVKPLLCTVSFLLLKSYL